MAKVPFPVSVVGGDKDSSGPAVAAAGGMPVAVDPGDSDSEAGGMPVDPGDSDSDKEHPVHEPQFAFHAVDEERRRRPALLPIHRRRPWAVADDEREERLRVFMLLPQTVLCSSTLIFGGMMIYVGNSPELRDHPDFDWNLFVTVSSALVMLFSLLSLLLSYLGVYYYDGWPVLNQWLR